MKFVMYIQGQGHKPLKVWNLAIFKGYLLPFNNGGVKNDH